MQLKRSLSSTTIQTTNWTQSEWHSTLTYIHPTANNRAPYSEEEDGNFYDGYLDEKNLSRSLTPSPNVEDDEFLDDSEKLECVDSLAFTPAQLEERLHSVQSTKRSRSNTVTLQNMYVREPEHSSDSDLPESDEEVQYHDQSSGDSEWETLA